MGNSDVEIDHSQDDHTLAFIAPLLAFLLALMLHAFIRVMWMNFTVIIWVRVAVVVILPVFESYLFRRIAHPLRPEGYLPCWCNIEFKFDITNINTSVHTAVPLAAKHWVACGSVKY